MKLHLYRRLLAAFGPALVILGAATLHGQQPQYYVAEGPSYDQRLAEQEARIRQLEAQLGQQQQQLPALPVSAALAEATAAPDLGACKEVDLITKPVTKIIGRLFLDGIAYEDETPSPVFDNVDRQNEVGISFARIGWNGYIYENVLAQLELDFAGSTSPKFKDNYIEAQNLPLLGRVRAGYYKEPLNLEDMTSDNVTMFMNRSMAVRTFSPSRKFGVMAYDYLMENQDFTWFMGTFASNASDTNSILAQDAGCATFDSRLAWNPIYDEPSEGRYLVHVGGSYSYRRTGAASTAFSSKPELGGQPGFLSTTFTNDKDFNQYNAEFLAIWGPASLQAEYYRCDVASNSQVGGGYVQASYFLTGENRGYKRDEKILGGVKPIEDFFRVSTADGVCMGKGAWELAARWSYVDLDAGVGTVSGGVNSRGYENSYTAGVNWYWNPYTRMMFDFVWEDVHRTNGLSDGLGSFGTRWQVNF